MPQLEIEKLTDICSRKHQGNTESREANKVNVPSRSAQREAVLVYIRATPRSMKEVAQLMGVPFNTISGRGSELKRYGLVEETGEVRQGSAVLRAVGIRQASATYTPTPKPVEAPKAEPVKVKPEKPMSASQLHKELKALADTFNSCTPTEMSGEEYDRARAELFRRSKVGK